MRENQSRLFSYIVTSDTGLAPNPYWGVCTLACCKPQIRCRAEVGDTVIGLSSVRLGHKLIYAMQVTEILRFGQYFVDKRFRAKIPHLASPVVAQWVGDNFYQETANGFVQLPSRHSFPNGQENSYHKIKDLIHGKRVLISENFHYLGDQAVELPAELMFLWVRRGHRSRFSEEQKKLVLDFVNSLPLGRIGNPSGKI